MRQPDPDFGRRDIRIRTIAIGLGAALCLDLSAACAALPGPHRALWPGFFGLREIAPGLWIDDLGRGQAARELARQADDTTAAFFGPLETRPRIIFCTAPHCAGTLGLRPSGLTYGHALILIGPGGQNEMIVPHERIHAELHRALRVSDLWDQRIPAWFNEGLASFLSGDPRPDRPLHARDADWICTARSFRDWGRPHPEKDWRATFGAAARLVAEIEEIHGRDGLRDLVAAVEAGAPFDAEYRRLMPAPTACALPPS